MVGHDISERFSVKSEKVAEVRLEQEKATIILVPSAHRSMKTITIQ